MRKLQNEAAKQIHTRLNASRDIEVAGFGGFCRIVAALKHEDNPLARTAVRIVCWSMKNFVHWVNEAPISIVVPVSKALIKYRDRHIPLQMRNPGLTMRRDSSRSIGPGRQSLREWEELIGEDIELVEGLLIISITGNQLFQRFRNNLNRNTVPNLALN
jgi:hypothetical protein